MEEIKTLFEQINEFKIDILPVLLIIALIKINTIPKNKNQ